MDQQSAIEMFLDQLINEKFSESSLDDATKSDIKSELADKLNQYMTLRTIEAVSINHPEAVEELSLLIKTDPTPEKVNEFITSRVTDPDALVSQILTDFHELYIGKKDLSN
ncbi:MAG: hypothetical protein AAB492_05820 [Patescibacteria group bacterium]